MKWYHHEQPKCVVVSASVSLSEDKVTNLNMLLFQGCPTDDISTVFRTSIETVHTMPVALESHQRDEHPDIEAIR